MKKSYQRLLPELLHKVSLPVELEHYKALSMPRMYYKSITTLFKTVMGIKHFFTWFKANFPEYITGFKKDLPPHDTVHIDTFMIDLNGVFHTSAQRVFEYGNFARPKSILGRKQMTTANQSMFLKCYQDVCASIEEMFKIANPQKQLVMCIDGVAPLSKQNQQRQRRYRGAVEDPEHFFNTSSFDTCNITPGTQFMDGLSKYIDWYIRKRISEDESWAMVEIIFSNEKVPGEGEHKLINYIRKYGSNEDTYCINALDADLVMLALASHRPNFYLLREDTFSVGVDYMYVNIGDVRKEMISSMLHWEGANNQQLINDFVLICFLCGNDFLPNIPSISIMDKGLDTIINLYKVTCATYGHLTTPECTFNLSAFKQFLILIANSEKSLLQEKALHKVDYIPDPLLDSHTYQTDEKLDINFETYMKEYNLKKFDKADIKHVCMKYLEGCQWVLTYYTKGISDWTYIFPFHYSPFATDLADFVDFYEPVELKQTQPLLPFQQLLSVLPPKSATLLPKPLDELFKKGSPLSKFCPDTFVINYDGKKKKWEGVVELPVVNVSDVLHAYKLMEKRIRAEDMKRNVVSKTYSYRFSNDFVSEFKSGFGNIFPYRVEVQEI